MHNFISHTFIFSTLALCALTGCSLAAQTPGAVAQTMQPAIALRTIYVSLTGSDANNGLSPAKALRSPQKAADLSQPGDVITFAAGTYETQTASALLTIKNSGEPGKPIVYTPAPGATVTLYNRSVWEAIKVVGARYIEIRGFQIRGHAQDVTLEEARREMNNLKSPHTCDNGIGITSDAETKMTPAYVTVRDCVISDCGGGGLYASHADYLTFENNVVSHCAFWSPYANSGISVYQPIAIDDADGYKILIRNNVSFGNYENIPFYHSNEKEPEMRKVTDGNGIILDDYSNSQDWGGNGKSKPYAGRTLVANNVVFDNGGSGIHTYKGINVDIVNNYAFNNNRHPELTDGQIFSNVSKQVRILNNVMIAPAGKPCNSDNKNEGVTYDYNLYSTVGDGTPTFACDKAHNVVAKPGLTLANWESGKREIKVTPDSPLRGAGTPFPELKADFFGKARSAGAFDIGPFALK